MKHIELILPFGIPPFALRTDLLRALEAPALARLLGSAPAPHITHENDYARALPHEYLLAGIAASAGRHNSPALTWNAMQAHALTPQAGHWFTLQPVHLHIARDHLVLTDQRRLGLPDAQARELFEIAHASCAELGKTLLYGDALTWFLRADDWAGLHTASADAACGHNIDIWMPQGPTELAWRKLHNEIQMQWFIHTINAEREMAGSPSVNALWLSAGADAMLPLPPVQTALPDWHKLPEDTAPRIVLGNLQEAALNSDWGCWLDRMHALEHTCFAPALGALRDGRLEEVRLIFSNATTLAEFTLKRRHLRYFWRKPTLAPLFSIGTP